MDTKGKVLIIDDEEVITALFKRFLPRQGYEFHSASNGPDGLKIMEEWKPHLVFLDLKMPGMDGLEVLKRSKEIDKELPVVILTGHGDLASAIQAVKLGAYDFMRKPIDDLESLLVSIDRAIKNYRLSKRNKSLTEELKVINRKLEDKVKLRTKELEETLKKLEASQAKVQEEIKTVSLVQQNLLPEGPPSRKDLDAGAIYLASSAVGGDYYDYFDRGDEGLSVVIADISGHGLPAAFVMTMVKIMLIHLNRQKAPLKETMETVNDLLFKHIPTNNFVSMIYGILHPKEMTFNYINAGHEPLIYVSAQDKRLELLPSKLPFLGIDTDIDFKEDVLRFKSGDKLVFFTDGITEAANTKQELFGQQRLNDIIAKNMAAAPKELVADVIGALSMYCEGTSYVDDITLVILGLK